MSLAPLLDAARARDPASCLCGNDRVRARPRPVRSTEGDAAAPDHRLDLGVADRNRGDQLVLDSFDPIGGTVQPDPFAVDLHADRAADRGLAGAQAPRRRPQADHDDDFRRRACHRRAVYLRARTDHARGGFRALGAAQKAAVWRAVFRFRKRRFRRTAAQPVSL